jgi:hypothetical protein
MSYDAAMEAAGAEVLRFQQFGSYQGEWYAKVRFNGNLMWVNGSYGSCSGCDAFEGEFGYKTREECDEHRYEHPKPTECAACDENKKAYDEKLAAFGLSYLESGDMTDAEAIRKATQYSWDSQASVMEQFIRDNALDPDNLPPRVDKPEED